MDGMRIMGASCPVFEEFRAYWHLSEEMIARATKDDVAEAARILGLQVAHYAKKYGELPIPDLSYLLKTLNQEDEGVGLLRDGTQALVAVMAIVTDGDLGGEEDSPIQ